jgi:Flp pilus assembly protein CpaB
VLIAVVVILAFVLNLLVLHDREETVLVAIADEPLAAGSQLEVGDLRLVPVGSDFAGLPDLITEEELGKLDGWVLSRPVGEGGLLDDGIVVRPGQGSGMRTMSIPVPVEHAAGGGLVPGDRVDVISVVDGVARFIAVDLEVLVAADASAGPIGSTSGYHIVVSVTSSDALDLAEALDIGSLEVIRSTGAVSEDGMGDDGS